MPIVAPKDSTLATISSAGASSDRSSSASTTKITSRIAGITLSRSASTVSRVSSRIAVCPPTVMSALTSSRSPRRSRTVSVAASESAVSVERREDDRLAVDDLRLGRRVAGRRPGAAGSSRRPRRRRGALRRARASPASSSCGTIDDRRAAWSDSKCSSMTSCASTESTSVRNSSVCGTGSSLSVGTNAAKPASARDVTTQTVRARRPTSRATAAPDPLGVGVRRAVGRAQRPERRAPEQHQRRRQQGQRREHRAGDADGADRAEAAAGSTGRRAAGRAGRGSPSAPEATIGSSAPR